MAGAGIRSNGGKDYMYYEQHGVPMVIIQWMSANKFYGAIS